MREIVGLGAPGIKVALDGSRARMWIWREAGAPAPYRPQSDPFLAPSARVAPPGSAQGIKHELVFRFPAVRWAIASSTSRDFFGDSCASNS